MGKGGWIASDKRRGKIILRLGSEIWLKRGGIGTGRGGEDPRRVDYGGSDKENN